METSSIAEFYTGKSIFVTGFSGFMGKVLVEKLLWACPNIKAIYVLIRPKKGQDGRQRVDTILSSKLFERAQRDCPGFKEKVIPVSGDMLEPNLGICEAEATRLIEDVSVVFHSAATIKFDEILSIQASLFRTERGELRVSVQLNVLGVKKLLEICHQMKQLEALVHVSTAYANCDQDEVLEKVYEPPIHPDKLLDAIEWMDDGIFEELTPDLVGKRPNTYTFTKALAEYLLIQQASHLPLAIVRPSIVGASWKEPFPGWVDNFNGPSGLIAAIGKGLLRIMKGDFNAPADIVPVDVATNFMIASAWYTASERPSKPVVYNCTTGQDNPVTWGYFERKLFEYLTKHPVDNMTRIPNPRFTENNLWYKLNVWFDHQLPAFLIDVYMRCTGKKPIFMKLNQRLFKAVKSLEFFTSHGWCFHSDNFQKVLRHLSPEDRKLFDFDVKSLNWSDYFEKYCLGTKQFVLKEELSGLPAARKTLSRLQNVQTALKIIGVLITGRFLMTRVRVARRLWYFFINLAMKILKLVPGIAQS